MGWYDWFASFYDASLEALYRPFREVAAERLALAPGHRVLDVGCGTGQSFDVVSPAVGPTGLVVGCDRSPGMLRAAKARAEKKGFGNVRLVEADLAELTHERFAEHLGPAGGFDRLLCFLVLSMREDHEAATRRLWELVAPGGRLVVVDAHAEKLGLQGRLVNVTAHADIRREVWRGLEALSTGFRLERLAAPSKVGGDIVVASGEKSA